MRSRPANASVIWVPIDAICTSGVIIHPVRRTYMMRSPSVISPARTEEPPTTIISAPTAPMIMDENADTPDTPVTAFATLRRRRWAPRAKTRFSLRSEV